MFKVFPISGAEEQQLYYFTRPKEFVLEDSIL